MSIVPYILICTTQTNEMHILQISTSIFNFYVFYTFLTRGFIFSKTVVYTVKVWYVLHASIGKKGVFDTVIEHTLRPTRLLIFDTSIDTVSNPLCHLLAPYIDAYETYHTITVYISVLLKMNPLVRNV